MSSSTNLARRDDDSAPSEPAVERGASARSAAGSQSDGHLSIVAPPAKRHPPFLLYGIYLFCLGTVMYLTGVLLVFPRYAGLYESLTPISEWLVWYSGTPMLIALILALTDFFILFEGRRSGRDIRHDPVDDCKVTVVLTAYNDEEAIGPSVADFAAHPRVERVVVVSNNSTDRTMEEAEKAGAIAVNETMQGYGSCVYRCFQEALGHDDSDLIVLCEGDCTFRADDIDKLLAYAPHADIVNGTRTVERLRQQRTQLTTFMFYGNVFVGKLLEAKHLGRGTITDVGTTYKLLRRAALIELMPLLDRRVNLSFNAHFLDRALGTDLTLVEIPVTFHGRVGESKGGNTSDMRAFKVGLEMIRGLTFGWKPTA
ncbi:MAG: glycosyltransferase family 2 protein [Pseudomonadota bacterium]